MVPENGLVAYYPLNGTAADASGNGHDGELLGATPTADRFGRENEALAFDGVDDQILISPPPGLDDAMSVSVWALPKLDGEKREWHEISGGGGFHHPIISQDDLHAVRVLSLRMYKGSFLSYSPGWEAGAYCKPAAEAGRWYHLVLTRDQTCHRLFVDGRIPSEEAEQSGTQFRPCGCQQIQIGSIGGPRGGYAFFQGSIDDVRIYDRALSAEEAEALFREEGKR